MVKDNGFQLASFILQVYVADTWCTLQGQKAKILKPNESQMQMGKSPKILSCSNWGLRLGFSWTLTTVWLFWAFGIMGFGILMVTEQDNASLLGCSTVLWTRCDGSLPCVSSRVERILSSSWPDDVQGD